MLQSIKNKYRSLHTNENQHEHNYDFNNDIIFTENIDDNNIDNI